MKKRLLLAALVSLSGPWVVAGEKNPAVITTAEEAETFRWRAQARERVEYRENWLDFNSSLDTRDDAALLQRLRLGFDWMPSPEWAFTLEVQDSRTFFDDPEGAASREFVEMDNLVDLRLATITWKPEALSGTSFALGRQVLAFGDQRLVGGFEWSNLARTFDAARATWKNGDFTLDVFSGFVTLHESDDWDRPDFDDLFSGVHASWKNVAGGELSLQAYLRNKHGIVPSTIFTDADNQEEGNTAPEGDYLTLAARWAGPLPIDGWDARFEIAGQAGKITNPTGFGDALANTGEQDLLAGAVHAQIGYTFTTAPGKPRVFLEGNYATGDSDPNEGDSHTFQNLFPTNHYHYGTLDRFSWQNMADVALGVKFEPVEKLTIETGFHAFWLAETGDVWRFAGQGPVGGSARYARALAGDPSSEVGQELDITVRYQPTKALALEGGYARFFAGSYIAETSADGTADDADFAYLQLQYTF